MLSQGHSEELEAWLQDGILTHAGLAFSRDGKDKVYIQHKMKQDGDLLARLMKDGSFYLCGPTWPVPDVHEAIKAAFMSEGRTDDEAEARIEELKEHERYVLEVRPVR
jgi:sulfite reductase (NADPH) flavoprotein alpha-component